MTDFGSTCIYYNQRYLANINIKGFLWLAGWSNYKPVFFHWRHEWTPSEFSFGPVFHPASPSGYEITALMNYINHNFPINPGEGWKKRTWFSSSLSDTEILSDSKHNSMFVVGWLKSWRLRVGFEALEVLLSLLINSKSTDLNLYWWHQTFEHKTNEC